MLLYYFCAYILLDEGGWFVCFALLISYTWHVCVRIGIKVAKYLYTRSERRFMRVKYVRAFLLYTHIRKGEGCKLIDVEWVLTVFDARYNLQRFIYLRKNIELSPP